MTSTSGSYSFSPNAAEIINQAYALIGVPEPMVDRAKLNTAYQQLNLLQSAWGNTGPNLWTEDQQSVPLVAGTSTYTIDNGTLTILNAWISYGSPSTDRIITSIGHDDYTSYPNKAQRGFPSVYWYEPKLTQSIVLWPVPDTAYTYTLNFLRVRRAQDAVVVGGLGPEAPFHWLDAMVWGLAERLAYVYAPDKVTIITPRAMKAYADAAKQDVEDAPMKISMSMGRYYR